MENSCGRYAHLHRHLRPQNTCAYVYTPIFFFFPTMTQILILCGFPLVIGLDMKFGVWLVAWGWSVWVTSEGRESRYKHYLQSVHCSSFLSHPWLSHTWARGFKASIYHETAHTPSALGGQTHSSVVWVTALAFSEMHIHIALFPGQHPPSVG